MVGIVLFVVLMLAVSGYAGWQGGVPERVAAASMCIAMVATASTNIDAALAFAQVQWALLWIDVGLLVALTLIAIFADRFWPLWLAGMQLVAVAAHGARGYDAAIVPLAYWWLIGKTSYPMVALLWLGVRRHRQRRRLAMPEYSWSFQRWRIHDSSRCASQAGRRDARAPGPDRLQAEKA
ncbi:hypothetical protein [Novosphingobium album (ex Liu et al. 2023)]|uniref:Uncharacterized protein n=1 Tax=Novosphingobium album (ex Liu et al. 2023) TaxID=3031130 RepID=A0ABT5WT57_9SPHN|nr:hypothetical protein [Novosphingobium album (ex Liu et al. 2023)]MDE8652258.1 hypothetical protein [Novosphingobium album (ex Liu et al. 2023)]